MIANRVYFVCGTDTDVGKTVIFSSILKNMPYAKGVKIIQTGKELIDQQSYEKASPTSSVKTLFHFPLTASPHLSAREVGCQLSLQQITMAVQNEVKQHQLTFLEGSGGIMSPITEDNTFLDLIVACDYPVLLVVKNTLGAINQALLFIEALQIRGIELLV